MSEKGIASAKWPSRLQCHVGRRNSSLRVTRTTKGASKPTRQTLDNSQVSGCQANLEVGDPLSGTTFNDTLNGFTYHPQELAFFSWFYHQSPSLGVNGWFSDQDTFRTFAAPCP